MGDGGSDGSKGTRIRDAEEGYDLDTEASVFEGGQDGKVQPVGRGQTIEEGSASEATGKESAVRPVSHHTALCRITRVISGTPRWGCARRREL